MANELWTMKLFVDLGIIQCSELFYRSNLQYVLGFLVTMKIVFKISITKYNGKYSKLKTAVRTIKTDFLHLTNTANIFLNKYFSQEHQRMVSAK